MLEVQEWADLIAAGAYDALNCSYRQRKRVAREQKYNASQQHEHGTNGEHVAAANAICIGSKPKRDGCIASQRERKQQPYLPG